MRKNIVAGNWKMNLNKSEANALISSLIQTTKENPTDNVTIIVAPPFIHLESVKNAAKGSAVKVAAQNCSQHEVGAYTGEVSAKMLTSYDLDYVILGHSERRAYFKETHQELAQKVDSVLANGMQVIFCCGETLEQRESRNQLEIVSKQISESLFHLSETAFTNIVIAYEPVWAIGTGLTASSDQAQEMHADLRKLLGQKYGATTAQNTSILYGGSCKPSNAKELFGCNDIDGGLIGGAALKTNDFMGIIKGF